MTENFIKNFNFVKIVLFFIIFFVFSSDAQSEIKILSWNIGDLPYIEQIKNKDERLNSISNVLKNCDQVYDVLVFEESFTNNSRNIIKEKLHNEYPYSYGPIGSIIKFNSGLWILSKVPLELKKEIIFRDSKGFDKLSRKGAALFEGNFKDKRFQLIITHLEDDKYSQIIRNKQIEQIFNQLIVPYSSPNVLQIICGDFNTDQKNVNDYNDLITKLDVQNDTISGKFTFDDKLNDIYKSHNNPRIIDYIFIRNSSSILNVKRDVIIFKNKWKKGYYLSDHNAIEAIIKFKEIEYGQN